MTQPINATDNLGNIAVPIEHYINKGGNYLPVAVTNPLPTSIIGTLPNQTLVEQKTQASAVAGSLTFGASILCVEIFNTDAANLGIFTVNGLAIAIPAGKTFMSPIGGTPASIITITGATTYIINRYI